MYIQKNAYLISNLYFQLNAIISIFIKFNERMKYIIDIIGKTEDVFINVNISFFRAKVNSCRKVVLALLQVLVIKVI